MADFKVVKKEIGCLAINFEEMKQDLANQLKQFEGIVVTEETILENKKTKANLNKVKEVINNRRKELKKEFMKPYEEVEKQANELISMIDEVAGKIDSQLKEFDEKYKREKKEEIITKFNELNPIVELTQVWEDRYLNKTESINKVMEDIKLKLEKIKNDFKTLEYIESNPEVLITLKAKYLTCLDVNKVVEEHKRVLELQAKVKADMEARLKAEQEAKTKEQEIKQEQEPVVEVVNPTYELTFKVTGTKSQIMALSTFLKENGYVYEKLNAIMK